MTVVLKVDPWKLMAEEVITVVELMGEYFVCVRVNWGCWYVSANILLSVSTWPEMRTTTVSAVVFLRTPAVKDKSAFARLFTSGVSKVIGIVALVVPVGHRTLGATPPGFRYHVCDGRGRTGTDAPVGPT
jgi:hypothetical protein